MESSKEPEDLKPQKDGSTPFGQGRKDNTVTQNEQARMHDRNGGHARGQGGRESRPTSRR